MYTGQVVLMMYTGWVVLVMYTGQVVLAGFVHMTGWLAMYLYIVSPICIPACVYLTLLC